MCFPLVVGLAALVKGTEPFISSPADGSTFPLTKPIPISLVSTLTTTLHHASHRDVVVVQIDKGPITALSPSPKGDFSLATDGLAPGEHLLKVGLQSPQGDVDWKDLRSIWLTDESSVSHLHAKSLSPIRLAEDVPNLVFVEGIPDRLTPQALLSLSITFYVNYTGTSQVDIDFYLSPLVSSYQLLWENVQVGQNVTREFRPNSLSVSNFTRPRSYAFYFHARAGWSLGSYWSGFFRVEIPGGPTLELASSDRFEYIWEELARDEKVVFHVNDSDSSQVWIQCQISPSSSQWMSLQSVFVPNSSFEVTVPFTVLVNSTAVSSMPGTSRTLSFRAFDGTFYSQETSIGYRVYQVGAPVVRSEQSRDYEHLIGDPVTFEMTVVDFDSPTVSFYLLSTYQISPPLLFVALDGLHPASSIIVTLAGSDYDVPRFSTSTPWEVVISDGVNISDSMSLRVYSYQLLVTVIAPNGFLWIDGFSSIKFHFLIRPFGLSVHIKCWFDPWDGRSQDDLHDLGSFNCVTDGVTFEIPSIVWDKAPKSWGYTLRFRIVPDDDGIQNTGAGFEVGRPNPHLTYPTLQMVDPPNGDLGSFPADNVPDFRLTIKYTAEGSTSGDLYFSYPGGIKENERISTGTVTALGYAHDLSPGRHTFDVVVVDPSKEYVSNAITYTYTITGTSTVGTFTIEYAKSTPLRISNELTVKVPLTIRTTGQNGTGPLELQYSTTSPATWIP
jgi:hypothetical protein